MRRLSLPLFRVFVAGAWVVAAGCSDTTTAADSGLPDVDIVADAAPSADVPGEPCAPQNDPDGDGISTRYEGSGDDAIHAVRALRSLIHGFATLEQGGGFGIPLDLDESFRRLIAIYIAGIRATTTPQSKG